MIVENTFRIRYNKGIERCFFMLQQYPILRSFTLILSFSISIVLAFILWQILPISNLLLKMAVGVGAAGFILWIMELIIPLDFAHLFERVMPLALIIYSAIVAGWNIQCVWIVGCVSAGLFFQVVDAIFYPQMTFHHHASNWFGKAILRWIIVVIISFLVTLGPIHLMTISINQINLATILSMTISVIAILVLIISSIQKFHFINNAYSKYEINKKGLWGVSRHPNVWGEMLLWWGQFLIMLSIDNTMWLLFLGPLLQFLVYMYYRIPRIEKDWVEKNSSYVIYQQETNLLLPFSRPKY